MTMSVFGSMGRSAATACGALAFCGVVPASEVVCSTGEIPLQPTNWQLQLELPRFDPALGILTGIELSLDGGVEGSASVENLDGSPSMVHTSFQATIAVSRPDLSVLVAVSPSASFDDPLLAFDGVVDFGGSSGVNHAGIVASGVASFSAAAPGGDLSLFTGAPGSPGVIQLPVSALATSLSIGSGNMLTQFMTSARATVELCYTYELDCNVNGVADSVEVALGEVHDQDADGVPDECQPAVSSFCAGDGAFNGGSECPCGNNGAEGEGCLNVSGLGGLLTASGFPSVSADTLQLTASQIPGTTPGVFFVSTFTQDGDFGTVFDNGLSCLSLGTRLKKLDGGGTIPLQGAPSISQFLNLQPGQTTYFQYWYRDPFGPCGTGSANATNGIQVVWGL